MTMRVYIGSKTQQTVFPVEGSGISPIDARRAAIQFARARHRIPDPIALTEHEAAVRLRRQFLSEHSTTPDLNGNDIPFWRQLDQRVPLYDKR